MGDRFRIFVVADVFEVLIIGRFAAVMESRAILPYLGSGTIGCSDFEIREGATNTAICDVVELLIAFYALRGGLRGAPRVPVGTVQHLLVFKVCRKTRNTGICSVLWLRAKLSSSGGQGEFRALFAHASSVVKTRMLCGLVRVDFLAVA